MRGFVAIIESMCLGTHGQSVVIRFDAIFELGYSDMELHWLACHAAAVLHHGFEFTDFK